MRYTKVQYCEDRDFSVMCVNSKWSWGGEMIGSRVHVWFAKTNHRKGFYKEPVKKILTIFPLKLVSYPVKSFVAIENSEHSIGIVLLRSVLTTKKMLHLIRIWNLPSWLINSFRKYEYSVNNSRLLLLDFHNIMFFKLIVRSGFYFIYNFPITSVSSQSYQHSF